jgi:phosphatidate cytidylyltransferase
LSATTKKFSNLPVRLATALLGAAGIIFGVVYSEWTYLLIFFIICFFSLREFYKLAGLDGMVPQKTFGMICGMTIFFLSFFIERRDLPHQYYFIIFPLVSCVYMIKLYKKFERKPFTNIAFTFLGLKTGNIIFKSFSAACLFCGLPIRGLTLQDRFLERVNCLSASRPKNLGRV